MKTIALSLGLFGLAALFEISGDYLVWRAWRHGSHWALGVAGAALLVAYGVVPTYQPAHFGRVYAAYGGVFVAPSLAWGRAFDGVAPDRFKLTGAALCVAGIGVMMYASR
jgi:small multidrug resistance family-3 protein